MWGYLCFEGVVLLADPFLIPVNRTSPLILMMKDQFANYVVQKMLDVVDGEQRDILVQKIKPHLPSLKKYTYGKHLITSRYFLYLGIWGMNVDVCVVFFF